MDGARRPHRSSLTGEGAAPQPAARGRGRPGRSPCARAARPPRAQPRVGAGDRGDKLVPHDARFPPTPLVEIRPVISGGACDEVPGVPGAGGHRRPPAQRRVLRATASCTTATSRCAGRSTRTTMLEPGERVLVAVSGGKDSLALWDLLVEPRLRGRRPLPRARHRRLLRRVRACTPATFAAGARLPLHRGRPRATTTASTSPSARGGDPPRAVRRVRALEAPPLQLGRARARLRRRRDRPQPRRRGRGAARQRAALGDRLPRPPAPGAARRDGLRAQGQAARAARRARDGGVLRAARHRLPGRGVPDGRGQPPPRVQGGAQRARGPLAGHEGRVPLRLPRAGPRALRGRRRATSATSCGACTVCGAPTPGERLRVLPAASQVGAIERPGRARRPVAR